MTSSSVDAGASNGTDPGILLDARRRHDRLGRVHRAFGRVRADLDSGAMIEWDIDTVRSRFPSLRRPGPDGRPVAWLDGPAGTQVVDTCLRAINDYLLASNANHGGAFAPSRETDELVHDVRSATADLLGATDADEVSFGPNMTTITYALSRAIGATLQRGDAIVLTRLDHDANVAPWLAVAEERGLEVRWVGIDETECRLDMTSLDRALDGRVRLVAVGLASNAVGTINPVPLIAKLAHAAGAQVWVDAVHAAPHLSIDRRCPRRRLPRLLGLQVLWAAPGHPVGPSGAPRGAAAVPRPAGRGRHPRALRDGHPGP